MESAPVCKGQGALMLVVIFLSAAPKSVAALRSIETPTHPSQRQRDQYVNRGLDVDSFNSWYFVLIRVLSFLL